jgi:hypothetical protein
MDTGARQQVERPTLSVTNNRVSICVNNYNYARFLGFAIESALTQTYPNVEVIVVDDGSTDDSRSVIAAYGDRIVSVLKENGGQGSAFNAGFAAASGGIVVFLDADDVLHPDAVARVVAAFDSDSTLAMVQYRLEVIDGDGKTTGELWPPLGTRMPQGDLTQHLLTFRNYQWQPTTGCAFSAQALDRILPMPTGPYRISADHYLADLVPFLGPVRSLEEVGGGYRFHGVNNYAHAELGADFFRKKIDFVVTGHENVRRLTQEIGVAGVPDDVRDINGDAAMLGFRLASVKLDPEHHPFPDDRPSRLAVQGIKASMRHPYFSRAHSLKRSAGFAAVGFSPKPVATAIMRRYVPDTPARG